MNPDGQSYKEDFADMFMGYFMGYFSDDREGKLREEYMEKFIDGLREDGFGEDGLEGLDNSFLLSQIQ
jgi:hypothetical protein